MSKAEQVIELICEQSISMRKACDEIGISPWSFLRAVDNEQLAQQYAHAMEARADNLFDEMLEISDETEEGTVIETDTHGNTKEKKGDMTAHRKLRIDTRKWVVSRMNPKKYGDRVEQVITSGKKLPELMQDGDE